MLNAPKRFTTTFGGKEITFETGRLAKQADGSVLVSCGKTQVLVTACSEKFAKDGQDFFPLLVEYTEKFYAAGRFLGGFNKREGRPTTQEILTCRLIDRPLRPLFPTGYMNDTVISATVMSYDESADPEVLAGLGASFALTISDIPFNGPIGACKIGRIDGKLVLNPAKAEWEKSDFEIALSASKDAILMVEGEARIVPEKEILDAIFFGHDEIKKMCAFIESARAQVGKPKREWISVESNTTLLTALAKNFTAEAKAALAINDKLLRQNAVKAITVNATAAFKANPSEYGLADNAEFKKEAAKAVDELMYDIMRDDIVLHDKRIAGRKLTEVRQIETEVSVLARPHGSALFTRGETQVLSTVTMGGEDGELMADKMPGLEYQQFYLHYNFPPYSVGEARGVRGVGRREMGHGNLAERALKAVLPPKETYPYVTRIVCEVLESNGSSSMGSVCSGSMALLDAGVPLKGQVAGIAMGLVTKGDKFKILTDILGDEDHLGDMDFKVAGTKEGITAIQMDIKIIGLTREIVIQAIEQARLGRLHILDTMNKTLAAPRAHFKEGVPVVKSFKIPQDRIGALIGPGGKNIKAVQEKYTISMEIGEDGTVKVLGQDVAKIEECIAYCELQINGPAVGTVYDSVVVSLKDFGAFVEIGGGVQGLVHVSEISDDRVKDVNDYLTEGDKIQVKVLEVDKLGRIKLSARAVKPIAMKASAVKPATTPAN